LLHPVHKHTTSISSKKQLLLLLPAGASESTVTVSV